MICWCKPLQSVVILLFLIINNRLQKCQSTCCLELYMRFLELYMLTGVLARFTFVLLRMSVRRREPAPSPSPRSSLTLVHRFISYRNQTTNMTILNLVYQFLRISE